MLVNGYEVGPGEDLQGVDLAWADLHGVDLYRANLEGAYLGDANLRGADLTWANLRGADLRGADLRDADLRGADLRGVNLTDALLPGFQIPAKGVEITGYKKLYDGSIAVLLIPADAMHTATLVGNKCRASRAIVIKGSGARGATRGGVYYMTGAEVYPDGYDADILVECTHGIHFFMTCKEAKEY